MSRADRLQAAHDSLVNGGIEYGFSDDVREVNPEADLFDRYRMFNAIPDLLAVVRTAQRVAEEREGHELGGESPLYVKLCALDEVLAAFEEGG